jgi:hypothetical protein
LPPGNSECQNRAIRIRHTKKNPAASEGKFPRSFGCGPKGKALECGGICAAKKMRRAGVVREDRGPHVPLAGPLLIPHQIPWAVSNTMSSSIVKYHEPQSCLPDWPWLM